MEWIFDGIGTEIIGGVISLVISVFGGSVFVYKFITKRTTNQKQVAGDDSKQKQELYVGKSDVEANFSKSNTNIKQIQKAGNNAVQSQIGGINDEDR